MHMTLTPKTSRGKMAKHAPLTEVSEAWKKWLSEKSLSRKLSYHKKAFYSSFRPFLYSSPVFQSSSLVHPFQTAGSTVLHVRPLCIYLTSFTWWSIPGFFFSVLYLCLFNTKWGQAWEQGYLTMASSLMFGCWLGSAGLGVPACRGHEVLAE